MPRFRLAVTALFVLAGCENEPTPAPVSDTVSAEAVEQYRTAALLRTQAVDTRIVALEGEVAMADSTVAVALQARLDDLRAQRRAIQQGLDSLGGQSEAVFREATQVTDARLDALERALGPPADSAAADAADTSRG